MENDINRFNIVPILRDDLSIIDKFCLLKEISVLLNADDPLGRECILRVLSRKGEFIGFEPIITSLLRHAGYFPYIAADDLSFRDAMAVELHRPEGQTQFVMHKAQADVYITLIRGENVILSAPTSFGKSLIVDVMIASGRYRNIMIVVPSIALIDETRKRVSKYRNRYKVITHPSQELAECNLFVLTQERAIEIVDNIDVDFFVIDEFYKLNEQVQDDRCVILNQVLYCLLKKKAQFYMLGPNIDKVSDSIAKYASFKFIRTDFATVVSEIHHIRIAGEEQKFDKLVRLLFDLNNQPTLIYCSSPQKANTLAKNLVATGEFEQTGKNQDLAQWLRDNYHADWDLPNNLQYGIGVHHGKTPRSIAQKIVQLFNRGDIRVLICTSTLIEGVNTSAKNVVVYDNKIARKSLDYFTYSNIKGRSGRMNRHLIGNVYIFNDPPQPELPFVDFPILNNDDESPNGMLVYLNDEDLAESSKEKIQKYKEQQVLPFETLKQNAFIDLDVQIAIAKELEENLGNVLSKISWNQIPNSAQLKFLCEKVWQLSELSRQTSGVASGSQLYYRLNSYIRHANNLKEYITELIETDYYAKTPNEAVELALDFQRQWLNFRLPRVIKAFQNIVNAILSRNNKPLCDYSFYASYVECYFLKSYVVPLDEYGLPVQVSLAISKHITIPDNIDEALVKIKHYKVQESTLSAIEKEFVLDIQKYL